MEYQKDAINPGHYKRYSVEVIDMMLRIYGVEATVSYCEMTAFKYRMRMGYKDNVQQELDKERWYLEKATELRPQRVPGWLDFVNSVSTKEANPSGRNIAFTDECNEIDQEVLGYLNSKHTDKKFRTIQEWFDLEKQPGSYKESDESKNTIPDCKCSVRAAKHTYAGLVCYNCGNRIPCYALAE